MKSRSLAQREAEIRAMSPARLRAEVQRQLEISRKRLQQVRAKAEMNPSKAASRRARGRAADVHMYAEDATVGEDARHRAKLKMLKAQPHFWTKRSLDSAEHYGLMNEEDEKLFEKFFDESLPAARRRQRRKGRANPARHNPTLRMPTGEVIEFKDNAELMEFIRAGGMGGAPSASRAPAQGPHIALPVARQASHSIAPHRELPATAPAAYSPRTSTHSASRRKPSAVRLVSGADVLRSQRIIVPSVGGQVAVAGMTGIPARKVFNQNEGKMMSEANDAYLTRLGFDPITADALLTELELHGILRDYPPKPGEPEPVQAQRIFFEHYSRLVKKNPAPWKQFPKRGRKASMNPVSWQRDF